MCAWLWRCWRILFCDWRSRFESKQTRYVFHARPHPNPLPRGEGTAVGVLLFFVRCKGGVSHHPAESVKSADVRVAIEVLADFILQLANLA